MKHIIYILILMVVLCACHEQTNKTDEKPPAPKPIYNTLKLHKLKKLFVVGDFDGDRKEDTIFQHNYSRLTKAEIENSPDPIQNDWDTVVNWFYKQEAELYLTLNKNKPDTLYAGPGQGLYCLINIGDNNADGKDEIAFVTDRLDYSSLNFCEIYSLCKNKWKYLKEFGIHEVAFNSTSEKQAAFTSIKDYLEKKNGKWFYRDGSQVIYDSLEEEERAKKLIPLKLDKCN